MTAVAGIAVTIVVWFSLCVLVGKAIAVGRTDRDECPNHHGPDGIIACWAPGGPCADSVCDLCGPCQHCLVEADR